MRRVPFALYWYDTTNPHHEEHLMLPSPKSRFEFTDKILRKLPCPERAGNYYYDYYYDSEVPNLWLRITNTGRKVFYLHFWQKKNRSNSLIMLGPFEASARAGTEKSRVMQTPKLNVAEARRMASSVHGELQQNMGHKTSDLTVADVFDNYLTRHLQKSRKTAVEQKELFDRHAGYLKHRECQSISFLEAEKFHQALGETSGMSTANRVIQMLRAAFNKAILWEMIGPKNPFSGISLYRERVRERVLSPEEVRRVFSGLNALHDSKSWLADLVGLALFTGIRKMNIASMRFSDVDLENKLWRVPDTKSGKPQLVALGTAEVEILTRRRQLLRGEFVFPGVGKTGHLMCPKKSWNSFLTQVGLSDVRFHDLRRTLATTMALNNTPMSVVKGALGHSDWSTVMNVYALSNATAEKAARESAYAGWIGERPTQNPTPELPPLPESPAATSNDASNVIAFRSRR
jgi:integrase